jgi:hypothetical protein
MCLYVTVCVCCLCVCENGCKVASESTGGDDCFLLVGGLRKGRGWKGSKHWRAWIFEIGF